MADDTATEDSDDDRRSSFRGSGRSSPSRDSGENKRKKSFRRKFDKSDNQKEDRANVTDDDTEDYWFVCNRWFAKGEDDGKIVRELLPTDEDGNPIDSGLRGKFWIDLLIVKKHTNFIVY